MAGEWNAITAADLDADGRFTGIEPGALTLVALAPHLATAKHSLRRKARVAFGPLYREYAISDTGLFDAVAALGSTGDTADLYEDLRHLLRLETLAAFYKNLAEKRGQKVSLKKRADDYAGQAANGLPTVAVKIWEAINNGDLTLTSDVASRRDVVQWIT